MHVEAVEDLDETFGVGAGAIVEGERDLVALSPARGDRRRVGEDAVDRPVLSLYR